MERWLLVRVMVTGLLLGVTKGQEDLDSLLEGVFPAPPGPDSPPPQTNEQLNKGEVGPGPDNGPIMETGGEGCQCVPYYLCANNTIITDGHGLLDIRIKEEQCESYMEVCCLPPSVLEDHNKVTPAPHGRRGCGFRNPEGVGFRITGNLDNEAQFGEFPWMIAVLKEDHVETGTVLNVYQCGGSLIHEQVVMTAAHCVVGKDPSTLKARAGEWDTQTKNELFPYQDRRVSRVIIHEKYYPGALYNDMALLILEEPFYPAENVDIVCLPKKTDVPISKKCFASGWGKDVFGKEGTYQVILKKVQLPIVAREPCQRALRQTRLGPYFRLHESFICAGGEKGKDTCKGDGGSPLVCPVPGSEFRYYQAGIVAWGIGCGGTTPAVYVNVAHLSDWIDHQLGQLGFRLEYHY